MTDIVEKLRAACIIDRHYGKSVTLTLDYDDYMEAAAEIERLRAAIGETLLEREDARAEVERLRAGGCARDQGTTQYCAEAAKLAAENEKLRAALELYRDAVRIDATMEGPKFMGANSSALKRAWDADLAALEGK